MEIVTQEVVRTLVDQQFPKWKNLEVKPIETMGHDNRTFYLGTGMTIRLPSGEQYAAQAEKEQKWVPFLRSKLSIEIPRIVAKGMPTKEYPYVWSICSWIDGETAKKNKIEDMEQFAKDLANFLMDFEAIDCTGGPVAGKHNFYRGGDLAVYDNETRQVLKFAKEYFDCDQLLVMWEESLQTKWEKPPVWVHGDLAPTNILVRDGRLAAVIDFGVLGIGDPACDLAMAWTFFEGKAREMFQKELPFDQDTWKRARGWVLWKTLLVFQENLNQDQEKEMEARRIIADLLD